MDYETWRNAISNATFRAAHHLTYRANHRIRHLLFLILLLILLASVSINCPGNPMARLVKVITPSTTNRSAGEYTGVANGSGFPNPNRSSVSDIFLELGLRVSLKQELLLNYHFG